MSTTIDQRVVEMRFDNQQFERNVSHTMSTLDKLKNLLNFKGASKGLESVNTAAKNVNMNALGHSVEAVSMKFSALQVMGVTALANITNSAVNAGKRIVSALTIDPITTGFQEYETQINAVQTILANTSHAGTTIDDVNRALEELNKYADQTIYNFTEMTRNIGTFTAAGVDLETSTSAIKGIANLAAVSGSTSQQASTAMYQLSQALAAGRVSLMDWNSVVNAGMGGKVFQDALIRTSEAMGTGAQAAIDKYGSFRESLTKGEWLTTDVLTETLNQFTLAAKEGSEEWNKFKAELKEKGYTEEQAVEILKMANTATDAATKVKTFTQLWDVLKESAQSGWSQTWKLIIGDFEEAKGLLTPIADTLTGFINRMSDFRNRILEVALDFSKPWTTMMEKLGNVKKVVDSVGKVTDKLEYFQEVVSKVWRGDYKNSDTGRFELLEKAGYDHRVVQDLVNKGRDYKLTIEDIEASHKKFGLTLESTKEETKKTADNFSKLSDEKLKDAGLTEDEIKLYRALEQEADRLGISVSELADKMSKTDGRTLLIDSFKNVGDVFIGIGKAAKEAWIEIFNPPGAEVLGVRLYGLLESLKNFTETLRLTDEKTGKLNATGEKIMRTLKGVFAIIDVITTIVGGGFKLAFKVVTELLSRFDLNILDITAKVGDALVAFHDWFESILNISGAVDFLVPLVKKAAGFIADLISAVKNSKWFADFCEYINGAADGLSNLFSSISGMSEFQKLVDVLRDAGEAVRDWITTLKESDNIPGDIITGLVKGITNGVPDVIAAVFDLAKAIIIGICEVLGIHSPATTMIAIGGFIIAGLVQGILEGKIQLVDTVGGLAEDIWATATTAFSYLGERLRGVLAGLWDMIADENGNVQWGKIVAGGMMGGLLWVLIQFANAFKGLTDGIGGIGDILEETGDVLNSFGKVLDGYSWDLKAKALQKMAIAIAILVAAIVVLAQIEDIGKLWNAVGIIVVLAGVLVGLAVAVDKFATASVGIDKNGAKIEGLKSGLLQIALCIGVLAFVVKMLGDMEADKFRQGADALIAIAVGLVGFVAVLGFISNRSKDVKQFGSLMLKLAIAMMLMVTVIKLVNGLSADEILNGILFAGGFALFVNSITKVAKSAGNNVSKVGGMILKLTVAMALMVGVVKLASMLSPKEMFKGALFAAGFTVFVWALVKCTKIGKNQQIAKLGGLIASISFSLMLMVGVCKLVGLLSVEEILKGAAFVAGFTIVVKAMVKILSIGSEQKMAKVGGTILAMAVAIGILAAVSVALGYVNLTSLAKGVAAVSILCFMMSLMVKGLQGAQNVQGSVMMMAIAIGVMTAAIIALTFIDDTKKLMGAVASLAIVMGMFALIERNAKNVGKSAVTIAVMALSVGLLAGILYMIQGMDPTSAIGSAAALAVLMISMSVVLKVLDTMSGNLGNSLKGIVGLTLMAVPLLAFVGVLALMNGVDKAIDNAKALATLATTLALLLIPLTIIGALATTGVGAAAIGLGIGSLLLMAIPLLAFVGILKLMSGIENATTNTMLLITFMTVVTNLLMNLSLVAPLAIAGVWAMSALTLLIGAIGVMAVAVGALAEKFPSIQKFLDSGLPILEQLAGSIGVMVGKFIGGIGEGLMDSFNDMVDTFGTIVDKLVEISNVGSGVNADGFDGVKKLLETIGAIALTGVGTTYADAFAQLFGGETTMEKFQSDAIAFFEAMKAIGEASTGVKIDEAGLDSVIGAAKKFTELQSSLEPIGGVISWFTGRDDLATFGTNIGQFISSMKTALAGLEGMELDAVGLHTVIYAATKLSELQSSLEPIGGVISWFTGRDDLATFGINVGAFIYSMKMALSQLEGYTFDSDALKAMVDATKSLAELQSSLEPIGGVISWFTGRDDLATFGTNIGQFISSMKTALAGLEGTTLDEAALDSVIKAAGDLATFQEKLEPMGTVITWFTGRTDLGTFGVNIGLFADAMGKLKTAMGENGITEDVVASITNAGNAIIELQKALPEETWFDDKMNLSDFSKYVSDFGTAMGDFAKTAAEIDSSAVSTTIDTAYRIKNLITSLVGLDTSGLATFTGVGTGGFGADGAAYKIAQAMSKYAEEVAGIDTAAVSTSASVASKLKNLIASLVGLDASGIENFKIDSIGKSMKDYANKVKDLDGTVVSQSITSANRLKNFISSLAGLDTSGIGNFRVGSIGSALKDYSSSVSGFETETVSRSISAANRIKNFISGLAGFDTSGVGSFKSAIDQLGTVDVGKIVKAFSGASDKMIGAGVKMIDGLIRGLRSKLSAVDNTITFILGTMNKEIASKIPMFNKAGAVMMTKLAAGISSKKNTAKTAITSCVATAASAIRSQYASFSSAGSYLGSGLVLGINSQRSAVYWAGYTLGQKAVQGEKDGQKSKSPSRLTMQAGKWFGEGLIIGIDKMGDKVYAAGHNLGDTAVKSLSSTVSRIATAIDSDIDVQPTIRPVLDLSDIRSGAGTISGMLGVGSSVGVLANVNGISNAMNRRGQNVSNADVVSAIDRLDKHLDNVGNTTYSIAGITYDDGSNIATAVKDLTRYARMERRV